MSKKEKLLEKLFNVPYPKNFTMRELDSLMGECNCEKGSGGRDSGAKYIHPKTGQILQFDQPHPENELYKYQITMVKDFLKSHLETQSQYVDLREHMNDI